MNDPNSMAQILSMAQSLGSLGFGEQSEAQTPPSPPEGDAFMPDMGFVQAIMGMMQHARQTDGKQEALLCALKPFLKPERRESIDRAMQLARISHLAGYALKNSGGLLGKQGAK